LSTLSLRVALSRFSRLVKHGDRRKHGHVTEIECEARRENLDEDTRKLKMDGMDKFSTSAEFVHSSCAGPIPIVIENRFFNH